jgi:hypothetical protein
MAQKRLSTPAIESELGEICFTARRMLGTIEGKIFLG